MPLEDRVVTTDQLRAANAGTTGWLQLGPGILNQLDPLGYHVLALSGSLNVLEEKTFGCVAHLNVGRPVSHRVNVLLPKTMYEQLPTAFEVLARVPAQAAQAVRDVELWLANAQEGVDDESA